MTRCDTACGPSAATPDASAEASDQGAQDVGVVIVVLALQHRSHALQSHAGVDRWARQGRACAVGTLLVLHEDEVPDLGEAVAIGLCAARRAAGDAGAVIVENLRARAARAGIAHRPEIIRGRDADDAIVRKSGDLRPQARGILVLGIDGDPQPVLGEAEFLGDEAPGELDRDILEIIAEREIAEHLEESVMARGVADILEVVVLAAGAHAFLRRGGAIVGTLLEAGEDVLELHHAGIGEKQGRVVARHERRGRHQLVASPGEIGEKGGADVVGQHGPDVVLPPQRAKRRPRACDLARGLRGCKVDGGPASAMPHLGPGGFSRLCRERTGKMRGAPRRGERLDAAPKRPPAD